MMRTYKLLGLLLLLSAMVETSAQSIQGKRIYVSSTQEVMFKFKSVITDYHFVNPDSAKYFEKRLTSKNFSINSTVENFGRTALIISEGDNTHLFILEFKKSLDPASESLYDFSTKKKLKEAMEHATATTDLPVENDSKARREENVAPQKEKADRYQTVISSANTAFTNDRFDEAKDLYNEALGIRPGDAWSTGQLAIIQNKKNAIVAKEKERISGLNYQRYIKSADSALNVKRYETARANYVLALNEKSNDDYAQVQLKKIEKLGQEDTYNRHIIAGREALVKESFDAAASSFNEALKIKPGDPVAKKELDKTSAAKNLFQQKQTQLSAAKEKEKQYSDTLALANNMFETGLYNEAKKKFLKASRMKPGDMNVAKKISEIDEILGRQKQDLAKRRQDSLNIIFYAKEIEKADKAFARKEYKESRSGYQSAEKYNSRQSYTAERIAAIDSLLFEAEEEKKNEVKRKAAIEKTNKEYNASISQGKAAMVKENYELARRHYNRARELKPDENYPVSQLGIIHSKLAEIRDNEKFERFVHYGDSLAWIREDLPAALRYYDSARLLRPQATYPNNQINAINQKLMDKEAVLSRQRRTEKFQLAFSDYRKAEAFRTERKYTEAYVGYSDFLSKIDTLNMNEYLRSEISYINLAKDYLGRLQAYKPSASKLAAKQEEPVVDDKNKKKSKKGKKSETP